MKKSPAALTEMDGNASPIGRRVAERDGRNSENEAEENQIQSHARRAIQ